MMTTIKTITLLFIMVVINGCSVVAVDQQSAAKTLISQRGNIVTEDKLSIAADAALLSAGLNKQVCLQSFERCLNQLSDSLFHNRYRQALAVFSELHYAKALQLSASDSCALALKRPPLDPYYANAPQPASQIQQQERLSQNCLTQYHTQLLEAVKFSYAYLFYDTLAHDFPDARYNQITVSHRLPSDLDIQTQDIYNAASNDIITNLYNASSLSPAYSKAITITPLPIRPPQSSPQLRQNQAREQLQVSTVNIKDYTLNIFLPNDDNYLLNADGHSPAINDLVSTYKLRLTGLNSISKRDGFGVSFVASLANRYTTSVRQLIDKSKPSSKADLAERQIYPTGHLLLTGIIKPKGDSILEVLSQQQLDIHLYDPDQSDTITVLGDPYPLAGNFSAGYAVWLAENQLSSVGYLNLLAPQDKPSLPRLFMLEPFDPNKRVIIMLHGLASSPATWVNLTNDIFNDDTLRNNYQVWQIFYPTNLPILENRYQIYQLLQRAYQQTDPKASTPASQNSVIIGHSMGAVLARMLVSDDNLLTQLDTLNQSPTKNAATSLTHQGSLNKMLKQTYKKKDLVKRFDLQPLPQVDTAIFLSAPFRGTDYADRWFTRAMRHIIHLPIGIVQTVTGNLSTIASRGELAENPLGALYLQNGASQLSDQSSFVTLTQDLTIDPKVTYHSIIANADPDIAQGLAQLKASAVKLDLTHSSKNLQDQSNIQPDQNGDTELIASDDTRDYESEPLSPTLPQARTPLVAAVTVQEKLDETLTTKLSDGIVPYKSAHLKGAASETIISGDHAIQENPQTILTLRHILHEQLDRH